MSELDYCKREMDDKREMDANYDAAMKAYKRINESAHPPADHDNAGSNAKIKERVGENVGEFLKRLEELKPEQNPRYTAGDIGNGDLFADVAKNHARCTFDTGKWYIFDGKRWTKDPQEEGTMELCKQLSRALVSYANSLPQDVTSSSYLKDVALKWRSRVKRKTIIEDAKSVHSVKMESFDRDPYLFNCQNGTLNLKTGAFYPHRPADMLTKVSGVNYDPAATCPRWEQFIKEIMQDDAEKARFLQKALGYALTGDTAQECFFVLYGATTRNGKGTTMEVFKKLMGDYGAAASPDTIAQKKRDSRNATEDIARLRGARFVNLSEPSQGMVLSSALVKTLTGNDTIVARFLHENSFEYIPEFKLFINTNHLPRVTDPTIFSSGRVMAIPFDRHFEPDEQDKHLKAKLTTPAALSGILNWCIDGWKAMQYEGLTIPDSVAAATAEYERSSDKMALFFDACTEPDPSGEIPMTALYTVFMAWCIENGYVKKSSTTFKSDIERVAVNGEIRKTRPAGSNREASKQSLLLGYRLTPEGLDLKNISERRKFFDEK